MKIKEFLIEKPVTSSWQMDIAYNRKTKVATMKVQHHRGGGTYEIIGMSRREFDKWHAAPSKGKYWHYFIKGFYDVRRIA